MATPPNPNRISHRAGALAVAVAFVALLSAAGCPDSHSRTPARRSVEVYDPVTDRWSLAAKLPRRISDARSVEVGGMIYIVGGLDQSRATRAQLLRFDPIAQTWEELADMPTPRAMHDAVVLGTDIYVVGGSYAFSTAAEVFDTIVEQWSIAPYTPNTHQGPRAAALGGEVYAIAGDTEAVDVFDPVSGAWRTVAPLPEPVWDFAAESDGALLYVIGGKVSYLTQGKVWIYDSVMDSWLTGPPMPKHGTGLDSALIGQEIFLLGEFDGDSSRVFALDTVTLDWFEGTPKRFEFSDVGVTAAGGLVYAIGGRGYR